MPPEANAGRLRLLSLALDDALAREDLDEAYLLLNQREECIAEMHSAGVTLPEEELKELIALNNRLAHRLRAGQSRMADAAREQARAVQAVKAYSR